MKNISNKTALTLIIVALLLAGYFLLLRNALAPDVVSILEGLTLVVLAFAGVIALVLVLITLVGLLLPKYRASAAEKLGGRLIFLLTAAALLALIVGVSQWMAKTAPILGAEGNPLPNSIASLEKVNISGVDQWLIIRGQDVDNPVLLFLSGGPGASEAARVLRFNEELEKHFVVVIWEQRGAGKSYPSHRPKADLTIEQYTSDIIELSEFLSDRFQEEKIYLVGHSWGTIIGVKATQQRPDLYHAYIGTAQMVAVLEADREIYRLVMEHSLQSGDTAFVKTLENQGEPPYLGKNPIKPYSILFGREYAIFEVPNIKNEEYRREGDILLLMLKQPEYGWLDRLYYLLGLMNTFNAVYPQLQDVDLSQDAAQLDLPVYIMLGRHDMNNPHQFPEEYYNLLQAPSKQLYFFEDSGHGMIWEEAAKFHEIMVNTVLAETYPSP